jgi:membrane protein implicated in regulation of membrane protease activity
VSTIPDLTKEMMHHLGDMFRNELRLARTEAVDSAKTMGASLALMGAGIAFGVAAITLTGIAVAELLPAEVPRWLAFLIAAIVAAVAAFAFVKAGQSALTPKSLTLPKTREQVGRDIQAIKEHLPS